MNKILVDTSVIIDFLRRKDRKNTLLFKLARDKNQIYISIITHTELYAGKSVWERQDALKDLKILFSGIKILPLQEEVSKKAGEIKAHHNINLLDAIIASTALLSKLELVTLNTKDFENIEGIKLSRE